MTVKDAANSDANQTQQNNNADDIDNVDDKAGDNTGADTGDEGNTDKVGADDKASNTKDDKSTKKADDADKAEDWRVRLAGGDEKELKRLNRFASEADVYKAYRELEKKKSAGELKAPLPKDPTPEELTQWRKENGIPETADKYDLKFDNGLVIGDEDKPLIDKFITKMHGENATPGQAKVAIATYFELLGEKQAAQAESDVAFKDESLESLREEWGAGFKKNIVAVNNLLQTIPEEARAAFETARTADGRIVGNDPAILKWLAATAYELNPAASVMPSSMSNPNAGVADEITEIEKLIGDHGSAYWKGPTANKMQARYAELLDVREKIKDK